MLSLSAPLLRRGICSCVLITGCTDGSSVDSASSDIISDETTVVSEDTDTGAPLDTADTAEDPGTETLLFSLARASGDCASVWLSLTRVIYLGEYFDYTEQVAAVAFDADCTASIPVSAITLSDLDVITADLDGLSWALLLPALYTETGATLSITAAASPAHTESGVDSLPEGLAYIGLSDVIITYISGDITTTAELLGLSEGWGLVGRDIGERTLTVLTEANDNVQTMGETIEITVTDNLTADPAEITLTGETDRDTIDLRLTSYPWFAGNKDAEVFEATAAQDGIDFSLTLSGVPPASHYLPTTAEDADTVFDTCCREEIPVAVEVPEVDTGSLCREEYAAVLLHFAEPTHLWAAEWYHLSGEKPGWRVRYEYSETAWVNLQDDDLDTFNLDEDCTTSETFTD